MVPPSSLQVMHNFLVKVQVVPDSVPEAGHVAPEGISQATFAVGTSAKATAFSRSVQVLSNVAANSRQEASVLVYVSSAVAEALLDATIRAAKTFFFIIPIVI